MEKLSREEQVFVNYNYVKGAQKFMKEAGLLKYANEEHEEGDAAALAHAMADEGINAPAHEEMPAPNAIEVANTLLELAANAEPQAAAVLENAAKEVAATTPATPEVPGLPEQKEAAAKFAADIKKANELPNDPGAVDEIGKKNYDTGKGKTTLDTAKGEIGKQETNTQMIEVKKTPDANMNQDQEGKDISEKNYDHGRGKTTLNTEAGEVGTQVPADTKIKMARLSLEAHLSKILGK